MVQLTNADYARIDAARKAFREKRERSRIRHRGKYNNEKVEIDGFRFDSKAEGEWYKRLKDRVASGEVLHFHRQVPFHLPGNVKYRVDFQEFYPDGSCRYIEVKGFETKEFICKLKIVEALYPVSIELWGYDHQNKTFYCKRGNEE